VLAKTFDSEMALTIKALGDLMGIERDTA
jgi:hypothetical protein